MTNCPRLLIIEGNPLANCENAIAHGTMTPAECYAHSLRSLHPGVHLEIKNGAELDTVLPSGVALESFDGVVVGGSGLHAYDVGRRITQQIDFVRTVLEAGIPVLGSCWGLQIAVLAAGGIVKESPYGREVGIARKVSLTPEGLAHPLFSGKSAVFDSPCIHLDEVTQLPAGAAVLASNAHSRVQALSFQHGQGQFWGVQYHPEFNLFHMARLSTMYHEVMIDGGFYRDRDALDSHIRDMETLFADQSRTDLAWKLGVDADVLDDSIRTLEIRNWVDHMVMPGKIARQ